MLDLNDIVVFARVVEAGSFTVAARLLGMLKTTVSRRIAALQYPGEVGHSDADAETREKARRAAVEALEVFHKLYMDGKPFIRCAKPSIADIRLAATLEFLAVIDYPLPDWAKTHTAVMEKSLGLSTLP
jgi:glutathione S-transferase